MYRARCPCEKSFNSLSCPDPTIRSRQCQSTGYACGNVCPIAGGGWGMSLSPNRRDGDGWWLCMQEWEYPLGFAVLC